MSGHQVSVWMFTAVPK